MGQDTICCKLLICRDMEALVKLYIYGQTICNNRSVLLSNSFCVLQELTFHLLIYLNV